MKLKVVLGIIGIALICVGLVAVGGETGCQPKEEAPQEAPRYDTPRYTRAQVITIAENYLRTGENYRLLTGCVSHRLIASYQGNGIWEITLMCETTYSPRSPYSRPQGHKAATFIFDEKTGVLH